MKNTPAKRKQITEKRQPEQTALPRAEQHTLEKFFLSQSKPVTAADKIFTPFAYSITAQTAATRLHDEHSYKDFDCTNKHWKKSLINLTVTAKYEQVEFVGFFPAGLVGFFPIVGLVGFFLLFF